MYPANPYNLSAVDRIVHGVMMHTPAPIRFIPFLLLVTVSSADISAVEAAAWKLAPTGLPERLVTLPQGEVSREEFLQAIHASAIVTPRAFDVKEGFLRHVVLGMEAARLGLPEPTEVEVTRQLQTEIDQARGEREFQKRLAANGMVVEDIRLALRDGLQLAAIVRKRRDLPAEVTIAGDTARGVYEELCDRYRPVFHTLPREPAQRAATVGGRDFSAREVVDWVVLRARRKRLEHILETLVDSRLLLLCAERLGFKTEGRALPDLLKEMFSSALTDECMKAYVDSLSEELTTIRVRYILVAFDRRPGHVKAIRAFTQKEVTTARLRAEIVQGSLQQGESDFAGAARKYSDCPTRLLDGDLGYLTRSPDIAMGMPPRAYGLDYLRTARGNRSPLRTAPDPLILQTALGLKNGETSGLIRLPNGFALVQRVQTRALQDREIAMPFLRARRSREERERLLRQFKEGGRVKWHWPASRRSAPMAPRKDGWIDSVAR